MPTGTTPTPPPAVIHAAQRQCTSQLLHLPPNERAEGVWVGYPSGLWSIDIHCSQQPGSSVITQDVESHYIPNPPNPDRKKHSILSRLFTPMAILIVVAILAESNPHPSPPQTSAPHTFRLSVLNTRIER